MTDFRAFFKENAIPASEERHVVSPRFTDEDGNAIEWVIAPVSSSKDEIIRKACTEKVRQGKQFVLQTDYDKYLGLLAAECTVFPTLNDKQLMDSYGVISPDQLLKAMLLPGEYANYLLLIQAINGFDQPLDEKIEEAKN